MRRTSSVGWVSRRACRATLRRGRTGALFLLCGAVLAMVCLYLRAPAVASFGAASPFHRSTAGLREQPGFRTAKTGFQAGHRTYEVEAAADHVALTPIRPAAESAGRSETGAPRRGAPIKIETVSIARGGELYSTGGSEAPKASARLEDDGRLLIPRGEVIEELRTTEEGVLQSWTFDRRPEGAGDLVVRLRVSGQEPTGETKAGLGFTDRHTGLGVSCGPATWIDARGVRTPVKSRYAEGQIELRVAEAALDSSAYPAVLDPLWGPELDLIGAVAPLQLTVNDAAKQDRPSVALGQSGYLLVWSDFRGLGAVRGTRMSLDGEVIDPTGFTIHEGYGLTINPDVAFDGTTYLVVWWEVVAGVSAIYGTLVDQAGILLGAPILITEDDQPAFYGLSVAFDSVKMNYLVVYENDALGISGVRVSKDGSTLKLGPKFTLSKETPQTFTLGADVACSTENCLAVWADDRDGTFAAYGSLVKMNDDNSNSAEELSISKSSNLQWRVPSVDFDGVGHYLVAWESDDGIFGARVKSTDGSMPDLEETLIAAGDKHSPVLARSNNGQILATWTYTSDGFPGGVQGVWIDTTSGIVAVNSMKIDLPSSSTDEFDSMSSACAGNGAGCAVAWNSIHDSSYFNDFNIDAALFSNTLGASQAVTVTKNLHEQSMPAFTSKKGSGFMGAWAISAQKDEVVFLLTGNDPQYQFATPSSLPLNELNAGPAIAWGEDSYLMAWTMRSNSDYDKIVVRISIEGGASLPERTISIPSNSESLSRPAVAFDGSNYLLAVNHYSFGSTYSIMVTSEAVTGASSETSPTPIFTGKDTSPVSSLGPDNAPAIAVGRENSLIVWGVEAIYAARISINGELTSLDPVPINVSDVEEVPLSQPFDPLKFHSSPDVASDGDDYLVVWRRKDLGGNAWIYGSRISRDGIKFDDVGFPISPPGDKVCCVKVTWDGQSYLVVWQDHSDGKGTLFGTWVSRSGVVSDKPPFEIAETTNWQPASAVASDGTGRSLAAYTRSGTEFDNQPVNVDRIQARYVDNPCVLPKAVTCATDLPACHNPGECIPDPGAEGHTCSTSSPKPDGATCEGGLCFNGECIPDAIAPSGPQASSGGALGSGGAGSDGSDSGCGCRIEASADNDAGSTSTRIALLAAALVVYARKRHAGGRSRRASDLAS
jgi:hypothetical protein